MLVCNAPKVDSQISNTGHGRIALMSGLSIRGSAGFLWTWEVLRAEVSLGEIIAKM